MTKFEQMNAFREDNDELPDGAFFALAEERGWTADDWLWFARQFEKHAAIAQEEGGK